MKSILSVLAILFCRQSRTETAPLPKRRKLRTSKKHRLLRPGARLIDAGRPMFDQINRGGT